MIIEKQGDVLTSTARVIAHQVNCMGIFGAGLAKQIKEKFPEVFESYAVLCAGYVKNREELLGVAHMVQAKNSNKVFANLFGQVRCDKTIRMTNYEGIYNALINLRTWMYESNMKAVAIPDHLSSGLAGGNWNIIKTMVEEVFNDDSDITVEVWKFQP